MEATAKLRYLRMSPRKVRLVADLIRNCKVDKALNTLNFLNKRAAKPIATLLQSAAANAGNKEGMDTETLYVAHISVDEGPVMKRYMPRAMGRASQILKRTSHINLTLKDKPSIKTVTKSKGASAGSEKSAEETNNQETIKGK